jgi:hypothetical protein
MTTTRQLSSNYDALNANERAALCVRALYRGDDVEFRRICDSAPTEWRNRSEHSDALNAISILLLYHQVEQLGCALGVWFSIAQSGLHILRGEDNCSSTKMNDFDFLGKVAAYRYVLNREAWSKLTEEIGIDASSPGDDFLQVLTNICDEIIPRMAPSRDELAAAFEKHGTSDAEPLTVDNVLADWRKTYSLLCTGES